MNLEDENKKLRQELYATRIRGNKDVKELKEEIAYIKRLYEKERTERITLESLIGQFARTGGFFV